MKWIDYENAKTVDEAIKILSQSGGKARPMAGGTDLIVQLRVKDPRVDADVVVNVKEIPELNALSYSPVKGLTIGAAVPCYKIYNDDQVINHYPALIDSASLIGGTQIQGRASLGGNLCNAAPSGDAIPNLVAHSGVATLAGPNGTREVAVEDICTGPRQTCIEKDEILVSINLPNPGEGFGANYIRFIPRNEMDIAVAAVGSSVVIDDGKITDSKIALAAVGPTPIFAQKASEFLVGKDASDENLNQASQIAQDSCSPITDMRGDVEFRKHLIGVLTKRTLDLAIKRAGGN